jgi:hypothetical protein
MRRGAPMVHQPVARRSLASVALAVIFAGFGAPAPFSQQTWRSIWER